MSRSSAAAGALVLALLAPAAASAVCLPPTMERGLRLQEVGGQRVQWLPLLLRQHEVCWREAERADEQRVFVVGNSGIFGFPHPVEKSVAGRLNVRFAEREPPAHFFNLGMEYTFSLKEALILRRAAAYEPDLVIYGLTLDDLNTLVPLLYAPSGRFMRTNARDVGTLAVQEPPGLADPFARYDDYLRKKAPPALWSELRSAGSFLRVAAKVHAQQLLARAGVLGDAEPLPPGRRTDDYDCAKIAETFERRFGGWQEWNVVAYVDWIRQQTGSEVLIVNWPIAREPRDRCYNARYTRASLLEFNRWLERETGRHGIPYVDLHDLLPAQSFLDSIHPNINGQKKIADALVAPVTALLRARAEARE